MYCGISDPYGNDDGDEDGESIDGVEVNAPAIGTVKTYKMMDVILTATDTTTAKVQCAMKVLLLVMKSPD